METVLRNIAEMTGGDDTKEAIRIVLGHQVNYIVYMLLIRINFYGCKITMQGRREMPTVRNFRH